MNDVASGQNGVALLRTLRVSKRTVLSDTIIDISFLYSFGLAISFL